MKLSQNLIETLEAALTPQLAVLLLLSGMYSLIFCIKDASTKHHVNAEKAARIGGWLYLALGAAILISNVF